MLPKMVIDDLGLSRYGFYIYSLDPAWIFPHPNGNLIRLWHDDAPTADEIREFSPMTDARSGLTSDPVSSQWR